MFVLSGDSPEHKFPMLPSVLALIKETLWRLGERAAALIGLSILGFFVLPLALTLGITFISPVFVSSSSSQVFTVWGTVFGILFFSLVTFAAQTFVVASRHSATFDAAFLWGLRRVFPLTRVALLLAFPFVLVELVLALVCDPAAPQCGAGLARLPLVMLVSPLTARLVFALPAVALRQASGLKALRESWRLTAGRTFAVLVRLAVPLCGIVGVVLAPLFIGDAFDATHPSRTVITAALLVVVSLGVQCFSTVYFVALFQHLQRVQHAPRAVLPSSAAG